MQELIDFRITQKESNIELCGNKMLLIERNDVPKGNMYFLNTKHLKFYPIEEKLKLVKARRCFGILKNINAEAKV